MRLTLAINDSDQVRDVLSGAVPVDGVDLTTLLFEAEEIFFRLSRHREWEISELSLAKYRRIGVPEWSVTATVCARAQLQHEYGVSLGDVRWVQVAPTSRDASRASTSTRRRG